MSAGKILLDRKKEGLVSLILNNPEKRNAIDPEAMDDLVRTLETLEKDERVRVILLTGQGEHFCAGGDFSKKEEFSVSQTRRLLQAFHRPLRLIQRMEVPVIAVVKGYAVGGGMSLALACDMIFTSEEATFIPGFAGLGLIPDMGGLCYLPLAVGLYRAKELLFSGQSIDAPEAYRLGMINRIFPKERLEEETLAFAQKIMEGMPLAIGLTKRILNTVFMDRLESVLEYEAQGQVLCSQTEEHRNRVAAVFRKTSPPLPGTERPKE